MLLSLVQPSATVSLSPYKTQNPRFKNLCPATTILLPTSLLPGFDPPNPTRSHTNKYRSSTRIHASLTEAPILWAARLCGYYALLKLGSAGLPAKPSLSGTDGGDGEESGDLGFSKLLGNLIRKRDEEEASERRKLRSKWQRTPKGTLRRSYRVNSKSEGRRLLKAIASLLSEDDHFLDASSHKGCQIRRESAHGESVCCNNVRALFDELPTAKVTVEITAFPAGPLGENDYIKAEKLERVLRSSPSI